MKPNELGDQDAPLRDLLHEWKVESSLPPRFQDRVWQRIARAETPTAARAGWAEWLAGWQRWLLRPQLAAGCLTVGLMLGFTAGWVRGTEKSAQMDQDLSQRYVQIIDPYQAEVSP